MHSSAGKWESTLGRCPALRGWRPKDSYGRVPYRYICACACLHMRPMRFYTSAGPCGGLLPFYWAAHDTWRGQAHHNSSAHDVAAVMPWLGHGACAPWSEPHTRERVCVPPAAPARVDGSAGGTHTCGPCSRPAEAPRACPCGGGIARELWVGGWRLGLSARPSAPAPDWQAAPAYASVAP